jgi:GT2 family glycosyltransferase
VKISAIISYYQRKDNCLRVVNALRNQTDKVFEIIVADDGSDVPIENELPEGVVYCRQKHLFYSPGRTRNFGATHANGDMYLFLDQDCVPHENFVFEMKKIFSEVKHRPLAVAGYIEGYTGAKEDPRTPLGVWENPRTPTNKWGHISGGAFCVDEDSFWRAGGCEPRELLCYDDVVFGFRLHRGTPNIRIVFCETARVTHLFHHWDGQRNNHHKQVELFIRRYYPELHPGFYPKAACINRPEIPDSRDIVNAMYGHTGRSGA